MLSKLQRYVEGFFASSAGLFHSAGFSPNSTTILGFLCVSGASILYGMGIGSIILWVGTMSFLLLAGFLDAVDGAMARCYQDVSRAGGVLDSVLDRIGEVLIYAGLALGGLTSFQVSFWALSASLMVSYIRARVEVEGFSLKGIGIAERPERLLIILVTTLIYPLRNDAIYWGTLLVAVLASLTVVERVYGSWKVLKISTGSEIRSVSLLET